MAIDDIGYRVGRLPSANRVPVAVSPDDSVECAVTIMLAYDFSQLPVMTTRHEVKGIISWKSLGKRTATGQTFRYVRECVDEYYDVSADMPIFNAMGLILKHEFNLYSYAIVREQFAESLQPQISATNFGS